LHDGLLQASLLQANIVVKNDPYETTKQAMVFGMLNDKFVAGLLGLVPEHLPLSSVHAHMICCCHDCEQCKF